MRLLMAARENCVAFLDARNDRHNRAAGLSLPDDTIGDLRALAVKLGLTALLPF
jgi:hypothetical protein